MKLKRRTVYLVAVVFCAVAAAPLWSEVRLLHDIAAARSARRSQDVDAAVAQLERLCKRYPKNAEMAFLLAVAHRRAGATAEARKGLKAASDLGWPHAELLRERHMIDFQSGKIAETEHQLHELLEESCSDDDAAEIYECMVKGYLSDVRMSQAQLCLQYWLGWQPYSVQAHLLLTEVLDAARDVPALIQECRTILSIDPKNGPARLRLAYTLLVNKDVSGARVEFEEFLRGSDDDGTAQVGLASCLRQLGEISRATQVLNSALSGPLTDASRGLALSEQGQIALAAGSYAEAKRLFEESLQYSPAHPPTRYGLGLALSRLGDDGAANEHLKKSEEFEAKAARLADVLDEIMNRPGDVELRCEAGELLLDQVQSKEALMWLLSALRMDRGHAPTHRALARYYAERGEQDMAYRHLAWAAQAESGALADISPPYSPKQSP